MTVTISRLYDNTRDAQQAVQRLEAAGVPHSDISIVANNSDGWSAPTRRSTRTAMVLTIAPKALAQAQVSAPAWVAPPVFSPGSACWRSPASGPSWPPAGWLQPQLARPQVLRPVALLVR